MEQLKRIQATLLKQATSQEYTKIEATLISQFECLSDNQSKCLTQNKRAVIFKFLTSAKLSQGSIEILLSIDSISELLGINTDRLVENPLTFTTPFQYKKRGVEMKFTLGEVSTSELDPVLVKNIIKANQYYKELKSGKSYNEIAFQYKTSKQRVIKLTELAFLSPKIVELILSGKQPAQLTSDNLVRNPILSNWNEQEQSYLV